MSAKKPVAWHFIFFQHFLNFIFSTFCFPFIPFQLKVAGEQSRHTRRWNVPPGTLAEDMSEHKQHELLKQIRLLVVAYDNMDDDAKEKLATAAEV